MKSDKPVIFFDGVCGLCNRVVSDVFAHDRSHQFLYAPLQGETARRLIPNAPSDTLIVWDRDSMHIKSDAALLILAKLGGFRGLLGHVGRIVPRFFADKVYDLVAANRYQIFGQLDVCRLPTPDEKPFFLD